MKQQSFSDYEYSQRKKKTRREEFLEIMDEIIPWDEWVSLIVPYGRDCDIFYAECFQPSLELSCGPGCF